MSWASGIITRSPFTAAFSQTYQLRLHFPRVRNFATGHKEPYRSQEVDRACGVPQTAPEAGPKTVGEVMRVEFWSVSLFVLPPSNFRALSVELFADKDDRLIGVGAVVGLTAIMLLLPDAGTKSANAVQKHIRSKLMDFVYIVFETRTETFDR